MLPRRPMRSGTHRGESTLCSKNCADRFKARRGKVPHNWLSWLQIASDRGKRNSCGARMTVPRLRSWQQYLETAREFASRSYFLHICLDRAFETLETGHSVCQSPRRGCRRAAGDLRRTHHRYNPDDHANGFGRGAPTIITIDRHLGHPNRRNASLAEFRNSHAQNERETRQK